MSQFLKNISLSNFRNYHGEDHEFNFHKKLVFIIGPNAAGKSNLLEAIQHLSFGTESTREVEKQILNVKATQPFFSLKANYECGERNFQIDYAAGSGSKSLKVNGVKHRSLVAAKDELLKTVSFKAKESLDIVRGSPSKRREWLDLTLSLLDIKYRDSLKRYEAALEQRNALLKTFYEQNKNKNSLTVELEPWNIELSQYGFDLQVKRSCFISEIAAEYKNNYCRIAGPDLPEELSIIYEPSNKLFESQEDYLNEINQKTNLDLMRGQTSMGPHRDDFLFLVDSQEARYYASQGQQRTCALALKLVQLERWHECLGYSPILLLDDITAELDLERQKFMFSSLPKESQVFVTTTHLVNLPNISVDNFQIINLSKTNYYNKALGV